MTPKPSFPFATISSTDLPTVTGGARRKAPRAKPQAKLPDEPGCFDFAQRRAAELSQDFTSGPNFSPATFTSDGDGQKQGRDALFSNLLDTCNFLGRNNIPLKNK